MFFPAYHTAALGWQGIYIPGRILRVSLPFYNYEIIHDRQSLQMTNGRVDASR